MAACQPRHHNLTAPERINEQRSDVSKLGKRRFATPRMQTQPT